MLEVNDSTYLQAIRASGVTLVDVGATWCPPCRVLKPILEELETSYGDKVEMLEANSDDCPDIVTSFGIRSNPTVIVFSDGQPVEMLVGLRPKGVYESVLNKYLRM